MRMEAPAVQFCTLRSWLCATRTGFVTLAFTPQVPWDSEEAHQGTRSYLGGGTSTGTQAGGTYGQETAPSDYAASTPNDDGPSTGAITTGHSIFRS